MSEKPKGDDMQSSKPKSRIPLGYKVLGLGLAASGVAAHVSTSHHVRQELGACVDEVIPTKLAGDRSVCSSWLPSETEALGVCLVGEFASMDGVRAGVSENLVAILPGVYVRDALADAMGERCISGF